VLKRFLDFEKPRNIKCLSDLKPNENTEGYDCLCIKPHAGSWKRHSFSMSHVLYFQKTLFWSMNQVPFQGVHPWDQRVGYQRKPWHSIARCVHAKKCESVLSLLLWIALPCFAGRWRADSEMGTPGFLKMGSSRRWISNRQVQSCNLLQRHPIQHCHRRPDILGSMSAKAAKTYHMRLVQVFSSKPPAPAFAVRGTEGPVSTPLQVKHVQATFSRISS
jgi:hypothetical protein